MIPDKSINLTLDKIVSYSPPKANSRSFHICMESWVEWADSKVIKNSLLYFLTSSGSK